MPSKKKMEFNNIVKEFGFPTSIVSIENTYKSDCLLEGTELWGEAKEFEQEFKDELERQNSHISQYSKDQKADRYYRFQDIFLRHQKIFDAELYLLQMSILMERDIATKQAIKAILEKKGIPNASNEIIDDLFVKDDNAISTLIQMLSMTGMPVKSAMEVAQFFKSNTLQTPNVYLPASNKRELKSLTNTVKNRLIDSDVSIIEVFRPNQRKGAENEAPAFNFNVINSQVHIGNVNFLAKKEKENERKYNDALREIDLGTEIKGIAPYDLRHIFRYPNLGVLLADFLYTNSSDEDIEKQMQSIIKTNLRYINFDRLLLSILQADFDRYEGDVYRFSFGEAQKLKKLSDRIGILLNGKNVKMESDRFIDGISYEKLNAAIEQLNNSYIAGEFYSEEELNHLAGDYIDGRKDVQTLTPHEFKNVLKFSENEILSMLKRNPELLDYLIRNNLMEDEKKENKDMGLFALIEKQAKISDRQLQILYDSNKLTSEYLLQIYMDKDKIGIEEIRALKDYVPEEFFEGIVNTSELVDLYLNKDKEKEKFEKYRRLFKTIEVDGKTIEEQNQLSEDILDKSIELLKEEYIMELYTLGLITVDTVIGYNETNALKQLYLSNELKPIDAKRLFYNGVITEEMLKSIMLDKTIDESRKITLLYSTFPEIEDTDVMKRLEVCLREVTEDIKTTPNLGSTGRENKKDEEDSSDGQLKKLKKAYEPRAKYRLLSIIDQEYKFKYNDKDGTSIFYFPNRDEYVIEKLYDKDRKPATNVATYILSKEAYEQNKDQFYEDGRINISKLYSLKNNKVPGVKRFIHTGWANSMVKYYDLDNPKKYSREQILETQRLAEQVEKSKKEIER